MPSRSTIRSMLTAGRHRISSGRAAEVVELVRAHPKKASQLLECLWDEEPAVAMRAADALEKLTRPGPQTPDSLRTMLQCTWKEPLIGLLAEATEKKLKWCLAGVVPRIRLTVSECRRVAEILQSFLDDRSSIVKTLALQGLADLARQDGSLLQEVIDLLRIHSRSGTPAMRARGRMLLKQLESAGGKRFAEFISGDSFSGKFFV
ncbi:MAG: hypothetical protein ABSC76_17730 [Terracidiphilus sp.]|jgi:hypothetical protein